MSTTKAPGLRPLTSGPTSTTSPAVSYTHLDVYKRQTDQFPFLLGHEAAGEVVEVGPDVKALNPGAFVVLNWRAVCGQCRACRKGKPQYCFSTFNATQKMTLKDGTPLTAALGIGAFCELTLVAAGQCTEVPRIRPEAASLLGCGVMAGLGAVLHTCLLYTSCWPGPNFTPAAESACLTVSNAHGLSTA